MAEADPIPLSIIQAMSEPVWPKTADCLNERVTSLYEAHRAGIYRFLVTQGIPPAAAQEVTQDVFVKLFIALRRGTVIVSEQGWLYSVAAKSGVDHWRRERNQLWVELDMNSAAVQTLSSQDPSPETLATRTERLRRVANAFAKLPKEQRLCVQLRSEGLRYQDIARILGVAVSTAAGWLSTAVERLRGAVHD